MAETRFPGPYVNSTSVDESLMKYVPFDHTDIGARASGMPKGAVGAGMRLDHVSNNSTGGAVKHKFPQ